MRKFVSVAKLVYVSCNPTKSLVRDATLLCGPGSNNMKGDSFRPTLGVPVDMFPQTDHCEMVMVFERGQRGAEVVVVVDVELEVEMEVEGEEKNKNPELVKKIEETLKKPEKRRRTREEDG